MFFNSSYISQRNFCLVFQIPYHPLPSPHPPSLSGYLSLQVSFSFFGCQLPLSCSDFKSLKKFAFTKWTLLIEICKYLLRCISWILYMCTNNLGNWLRVHKKLQSRSKYFISRSLSVCPCVALNQPISADSSSITVRLNLLCAVLLVGQKGLEIIQKN